MEIAENNLPNRDKRRSRLKLGMKIPAPPTFGNFGSTDKNGLTFGEY